MTSLRTVRLLVGGYMTMSLAAVVAIVVLSRLDPGQVSPEAWVRGIIVAGTSVLTFAFARRAAAGSSRALLRLRIVLIVILAAVVAVLFFVPLPTWMLVEQAACGLLLLASTVIVARPGS